MKQKLIGGVLCQRRLNIIYFYVFVEMFGVTLPYVKLKRR